MKKLLDQFDVAGLTRHQYNRRYEIAKFYTNHTLNSQETDDFFIEYRKLRVHLANTDDINKFKQDYLVLYDAYKGLETTTGHIISSYFFLDLFSYNTLSDEHKTTKKQVADILYDNFENKATFDRILSEVEKFENLVNNKSEKIRLDLEKKEREKKAIPYKTMGINTRQDIIKLINKTTLNDILKDEIIQRLKECDFLEIINDGYIRCSLDVCLLAYEILTGTSPYVNDKEKDDVEPTIRKHFKDSVSNFPLIISTEDYIQLYP